jgi:cytochrome c556
MKYAILAAMLSLAATAVIAEGDPIAARQALMKAQAAQAVVGVRMLREREPFEPAKAAAVYAALLATTQKFGALFPDNSKTGDTKASPKIWEDRKGFEAALAKFSQERPTRARSRRSTSFAPASTPWPRIARAATRPIACPDPGIIGVVAALGDGAGRTR